MAITYAVVVVWVSIGVLIARTHPDTSAWVIITWPGWLAWVAIEHQLDRYDNPHHNEGDQQDGAGQRARPET